VGDLFGSDHPGTHRSVTRLPRPVSIGGTDGLLVEAQLRDFPPFHHWTADLLLGSWKAKACGRNPASSTEVGLNVPLNTDLSTLADIQPVVPLPIDSPSYSSVDQKPTDTIVKVRRSLMGRFQ